MKSKKRNSIIGILSLFLLVSCASNDQGVFETPLSSISEYGYTKELPVVIGAPTAQEREIKTNLYFEGLRSENGEKFEIISKTTVLNPNHKDPRIKIYDIITDEIINGTKGKFLDSYTLQSIVQKDTVVIYVMKQSKGKPMIPAGLNFASN